MQHGAGGRGQDAQSPQKDEGRVEAESPDKIIAALRGRYFSFPGKIAPGKFYEPSERDTDFLSTPLHKQGQELRSEQTVTPIHEQRPFTYFLRLNNSETFVENAF